MPLRPLVTLPLFPGGMEEEETPQGGIPPHLPLPPPPLGDNDDPYYYGALDIIEEEPVTEHTNSSWNMLEAYEMDDGGGSGDDEIEWKFWDSDAPGSKDGLVTEDLTFLGQPARFASYNDTAGYMRLAAIEEASPPAAGAGHEHDGDGDYGVIDVHFRHSRMRFLRPRGSNTIEYPSFATTGVQRFRYLVPFAAVAANPVSSLRLAGASLASDLYPYSSFLQLQAVWWGLVAAAPVRVPPGATRRRLVVTVDVGVLRGEEDDLITPENMERMRSKLAEKARDADGSTAPTNVQEQLLPAPVCRNDDDDVAGGGDEVCAICREGMEEGCRVAWPRCCHVFHGKCLERLLATVRRLCPLCRSTLSVNGMFVDDDPRWPTS